MSCLRKIMQRARGRKLQWLCASAFLVLSVACPTIGVSATNLDDLKLKGKKMAAIRAASEAISTIPNFTSQNFAESATLEIVKDYQKHQNVAASERIIRKRLKKTLREEISNNFIKIYNQMRVNSELYSKKQFLEDIDSAYGQKIENGITENVKRQFNDVFAKIRAGAVERQYKSLELSIYPTQEEIAAADKKGWEKSRIDVKNSLRSKMQGKVSSLLEENVPKVEQSAAEVIRDIDSQRKRQREVIDSGGDTTAFSMEGISQELESNLKKALAKDRKNRPKNKTVYDIFPSIRKRLEEESSRLEAEKFEAYIPTHKVKIDKSILKRLIEKNRRKHTRLDNSFNEAAKAFTEKAEKGILESYLKKASRTGAGKKFNKRLKARLREQHYQQLVADSVRKYLRAPLRQVREDISVKEMRKKFAPVATKKWEVPKDVRPKDWGRLEAVDTFDEVQALPNIKSKKVKVDHSLLLDETKEKVEEAIPPLVSEGKTAWEAQQAIADRIEETILTDINNALGQKPINHKMTAKEVNQSLNKEMEKKYVNQYQDVMKNTWKKERLKKKKYAKLFPYTEEVVEKNVHNAFNVVRQSRLDALKKKKETEKRRVEAARKVALRRAEKEYEKDLQGLHKQRRKEFARLEQEYNVKLGKLERSRAAEVEPLEKEAREAESEFEATREEIREAEEQERIAAAAETDDNDDEGLPSSTGGGIPLGPGSVSEPGDGSTEASSPGGENPSDATPVASQIGPADPLPQGWWKLIPNWILWMVILIFLILVGGVIYLLFTRRNSKSDMRLENVRNDEDFEQLAKRLAEMFNGRAKVKGRTVSILTQSGEVRFEIRTT